MREAITLPDLSKVKIVQRIKPNVPPEWYKHYPDKQKYRTPVASYGEGYRFHVTGLAHDSYGYPTNKSSEVGVMMERLKKKITHHVDDLIQLESFMMEDAKIALFSAGIISRAAKEAVVLARRHGIKVGLLRPLTIWPFPEEAIRKYFANIKTIIVPELNQGQLILQLKRSLQDISDHRHRNIIPMQKNNGLLINPEEIFKKIKEVR
jgi:2-oxoglutarate ferredoxin oxidoreductase subunit alpha